MSAQRVPLLIHEEDDDAFPGGGEGAVAARLSTVLLTYFWESRASPRRLTS